eukprot:gene13307-biopygen16563
MNSCHEED